MYAHIKDVKTVGYVFLHLLATCVFDYCKEDEYGSKYLKLKLIKSE